MKFKLFYANDEELPVVGGNQWKFTVCNKDKDADVDNEKKFN